MLSDDARRFLARQQANRARRDLVQAVIDDCYEFTQPLRNRIGSTTSGSRTDALYDSTAAEAAQDLASTVWNDVWPSNARPFDLVAGSEIPPARRDDANRALAAVADDLIETANNSNLGAEAKLMLYDWLVGTGVMLVDEGDVLAPVTHRAVPLTECVLGTGPHNAIDSFWRELRPRLVDIPVMWPDAVLPAELRRAIAEAGPDTTGTVIEGIERDWTARGEEAWRFMAILQAPHECILQAGEYRGAGSCPVLWPSFERMAGEPIGRGPTQIALPDVKTLNKVKEMVLANAELAIGGIWQAESDGVLNVDTIRLEPRTILPVAPGSQGLRPIEAPGRFDVAQLVINDLQAAIRRVFFVADLGPLDQTPRTATEISARIADRAKRLAGPTTNLLTEWLFPYVRRLAFIRQRQLGQKLPAFDGKRVAIVPRGPLTLAQREEEVLRLASTLQLAQQLFGPQIAGLVFDQEKTASYLASARGLPPDLVRTAPERQALVAGLAQLAAQAQQGEAMQAGAAGAGAPMGAPA